MHYLFTSPDTGLVKSNKIEVESYDALGRFIEENLAPRESHISAAGKRTPYTLKEKNPVKNSMRLAVCPSSAAVVDELVQKTLYSEVIIQPRLEGRNKRALIRALVLPPRVHVFTINERDSSETPPAEEGSDTSKGPLILKTKDHAYPQVEEQSQLIFSLLSKLCFLPTHVHLEGLTLDFLQQRYGV